MMSTILKYILISLLFFSCVQNAEHEKKTINEIISPFFKKKEKFTILLLKNSDCMSCEVSVAYFINNTNKRNVFVVAQKIREIEKKSFYASRPFLNSVEHVFNDSLSMEICEMINFQLQTSIILFVENDKIIHCEYLREYNNIKEKR